MRWYSSTQLSEGAEALEMAALLGLDVFLMGLVVGGLFLCAYLTRGIAHKGSG